MRHTFEYKVPTSLLKEGFILEVISLEISKFVSCSVSLSVPHADKLFEKIKAQIEGRIWKTVSEHYFSGVEDFMESLVLFSYLAWWPVFCSLNYRAYLDLQSYKSGCYRRLTLKGVCCCVKRVVELVLPGGQMNSLEKKFVFWHWGLEETMYDALS